MTPLERIRKADSTALKVYADPAKDVIEMTRGDLALLVAVVDFLVKSGGLSHAENCATAPPLARACDCGFIAARKLYHQLTTEEPPT